MLPVEMSLWCGVGGFLLDVREPLDSPLSLAHLLSQTAASFPCYSMTGGLVLWGFMAPSGENMI